MYYGKCVMMLPERPLCWPLEKLTTQRLVWAAHFGYTSEKCSKYKHGCKFAGEHYESGVAAFLHNGRVGESGGVGDQSAVLGELCGAAPALNPEPEGKRKPSDEGEADEERAFLSKAANTGSPTVQPLCPHKNKYPQTAD